MSTHQPLCLVLFVLAACSEPPPPADAPVYDGTCVVDHSGYRAEYHYVGNELQYSSGDVEATYRYGPLGLTKLMREQEERTFVYENGRVARVELRERSQGSSFFDFLVATYFLSYGAEGRLVQIQSDHLDGSWVRHLRYDGAHLATVVFQGQGEPEETRYGWNAGRLVSEGVEFYWTDEFRYDDSGHLRRLRHRHSGVDEDYELDEHGRRTETHGEVEVDFEYEGTFGSGAVCGREPSLPGFPRRLPHPLETLVFQSP